MTGNQNTNRTRREFISELATSVATIGGAGTFVSRHGLAAQGASKNVLVTLKIDDHQELQKLGGSVLVKKSPAGELLVVRSGISEYSAFSAVCPHMQCIVKVTSANMIQCPCHKSGYRIDGEYMSGPAKTGLRKFPVVVESGVINVLEG